eukprot:gene3732-4081_t
MQNPTNWKKDKINVGPELSDISDDDEEEEDMALLQHGGNVDPAVLSDCKNNKRNRVFWTTEKEDYLLRVYNHYRRTYSGGHGLKGKSWRYIAVHMCRRYNEDFDSKSCRNKLNVLKYDYIEVKAMAEARRNGTDNDAFWTDLSERYPRALKWKDTPYPHTELLRIILEENGEGLDPMPELNEPIPVLPVETPVTKKRPRDSMGTASNYKLYKMDPAFSGGIPMATPAPGPSNADMLKLFEALAQKMQAGFDELHNAIKNLPLSNNVDIANMEARKRCMEELQKEQYAKVLGNPQNREKAFEIFRDVGTANDFMLYPQDYRHLFLEDLLNKSK